MKLATFRPGAESFKRRFPIPPPPIEGTLIGGLRVRRDGGTVYYVFQGLRLPAAAPDEVRVWAEEWSYKGWDAALLIAGMVLAVLGVGIERAHVAAPPSRGDAR